MADPASRETVPDIADTAPRHLTQLELAERWRVSVRTLERWRMVGTGPLWLRLGERKVVYRLVDVLAHEEARIRASSGSLDEADAQGAP